MSAPTPKSQAVDAKQSRRAHLFGAAPQVSCWRLPKLLAEHGDERTGAVISRIQRCGGHFLSGSKPLHGMKQAKLLPPLAESHFCLFAEKSLNGSLACAALPAQFF